MSLALLDLSQLVANYSSVRRASLCYKLFLSTQHATPEQLRRPLQDSFSSSTSRERSATLHTSLEQPHSVSALRECKSSAIRQERTREEWVNSPPSLDAEFHSNPSVRELLQKSLPFQSRSENLPFRFKSQAPKGGERHDRCLPSEEVQQRRKVTRRQGLPQQRYSLQGAGEKYCLSESLLSNGTPSRRHECGQPEERVAVQRPTPDPSVPGRAEFEDSSEDFGWEREDCGHAREGEKRRGRRRSSVRGVRAHFKAIPTFVAYHNNLHLTRVVQSLRYRFKG